MMNTPEETKEEYIARHRREWGIAVPVETVEEDPDKKTRTFKEKIKILFFIAGLALFLWLILEMFGMRKSN